MSPTKNECETCQGRKSHQKRILSGPPRIPKPSCSLSKYLLDNLKANPSQIVQLDAETEKYIRAWDILRDSAKLANVLIARGIKVGDRISIVSENRLNWIIPTCASFFVGAIIVPLSPTYTEGEYQHMLTISKPKMIFASRKCEEILVRLLPKLSWSIEIVELDEEPCTKGLATLTQLLKNGEDVDPETFTPVEIGDPAKHPAAILASSGTTGLPKGVTLSHRSVAITLRTLPNPDAMSLQPNDKLLLFLPFYHGYGLAMLLLSISTGFTTVISRSFNGIQTLRHIEKYRITHLAVVPPVCVFLAKEPTVPNYDLSSVKLIICGAAPFPVKLMNVLTNRIKGVDIRNAYGMTELSVVSTINHKRNRDPASVGPLLEGYQGKIVDPHTGELLGPGEIGEICFKADHLMLGYWENEAQTTETYDREGWLHTGDLGYFDENECLFVVGRLKELIKYNGFQVAPVELETLILSLPGVKDAAVVGKPDEKAGELPTAFVVKHQNSNITAKEIIDFVSRNVSGPKRLRGGVKFVDSIPKNPTGKILRRKLIALTSKL